MKWGQRWGLKWGWEGVLPQTVKVKIIKGKYYPCISCAWFSVCVVPKGNFHQKLRQYYGSNDITYRENMGGGYAYDYYQCEDYAQRKN